MTINHDAIGDLTIHELPQQCPISSSSSSYQFLFAISTGSISVFRQAFGLDLLGNTYLTCVIFMIPFFLSFMSSTWLILSMTFERFYSIVRPHKAASFNTLKKAKITILCIFLFFTIFNIPHAFLSDVDGLRCVPWGKASNFGTFHFYLEMTIAFILPFILLLLMNCVIINTLRNRSNIRSEIKGQGQIEGQANKTKSYDNQITVTLLVVTFSFLILTTPFYIIFIYLTSFRMQSSLRGFATFYLAY